MRPTHLLKIFALLCATASVAFGQSPTASPKAPATATSPATSTSTTTSPTTASSPATTTSSSAMPDAEMMKQMMELAKLNENHKALGQTTGSFSYVVKMWMDPNAKPQESKGTANRKAVMDGRYITGDYSGSFKMPGPDGKMKDMNFKGMSLDGYDNVKKQFVSAWVDNFGTGIMITTGSYDTATKTFTYAGEYEAMPGMKAKVREVIKVTDKGMVMEYYEDRGQGEMKSMEIDYTRRK